MTAAVTDLAAYRQRLRRAGVIAPEPVELAVALVAATIAFWAAWGMVLGARSGPVR